MSQPAIERRAACACGQLEVICRGEPIRVSMCHCLECQRRSGAPFALQARYAEADVASSGAFRIFERVGDEGSRGSFRFCVDCGSTVFYVSDAMPGVIAVAVGAFAVPTFPPPTWSVYEMRRHPWTRIGDPPGIERLD